MQINKNAKGRAWTMVIYPESMPDDWLEVLQDSHVQFAVSPLHDQDENPDGTVKKPHYHLLILYDSPTTFKNVAELAERMNAPIPQKVSSSKGLVRYMIHQDNPEKHQYSREDIKGYNGFDVDSFFEISKSQRLDVLKEISVFVMDNDIVHFDDLVNYAIYQADSPDWFEVISCHSTMYLNKLIDSVWQKQNNGKKS